MTTMGVGGACSIEGCNRQKMFNSPVCYKHKNQKHLLNQFKETDRIPGQDLWWTGKDESQLCDDNPDLHYGLCEFDTYDGICWHCKNMVNPDIHLIHLISNRRTSWKLLESFKNIEREDIDAQLEEELDRILGPLEERDIAAHPSLPPEERVKALQKMDDRVYILSELETSFPDWKEKNLSQFDLDPDGVGLGYMIDRLYNDIHHFNQEDWGPEWAAEWGIEKPEPPFLRTNNQKDSNSNPIAGWFLIVCYVYFILNSGSLNAFEGSSGAGAEFLCFVFLAPVLIIRQLFMKDGEWFA